MKISDTEKDLRVIASKELFLKGYSCSQAVCGAFADDFYIFLPKNKITQAIDLKENNKLSSFGMNSDMLLKISSSFGGGFGRQRLTCGAVSGAGIILGGYLNDGDFKTKEEQYKIIKQFSDEFIKLNGTLMCGELLKNVKNLTEGITPQVRDENYYKLRPCAKFVTDACQIIISIINANV